MCKRIVLLWAILFLLDGEPFQMISGEIHYPRVPREAWRSRMKMAKAMGLNTIGTYIFITLLLLCKPKCGYEAKACELA